MQKLYCILILLLIQVHVCVGQQSVPPQDDKSRISVLEYQLTELKAHNAALQQQLELRTDNSFKQLEERLELKSEDVDHHAQYIDWIFYTLTGILALLALGIFGYFFKQFRALDNLNKKAEAKLNEIELTRAQYDGLLKLSPNIDSVNSNIGNNEELTKAIQKILGNAQSSEFEKTYAGAVQLFADKDYANSLISFYKMLKEYSPQIGIELRSMMYTYMSYCYIKNEKIAIGFSYSDAAIYLNPGNEQAWLFKGLSLMGEGITNQQNGHTVEPLKLYKELLECFEQYKELSKADDADGLIESLKELIKAIEAEIEAKNTAE